MLKKSSLFLISAIFFLGGCSMMPYNNDFSCQKGKNSGVCASVSEVYEMSQYEDGLKEKNNTCNCKNETYALKSTDNSRVELNDVIQAVEIEKIKKYEQPKYYIKSNKSNNEKKISNFEKLSIKSKTLPNQKNILNRYVKVCVYRANIREFPSCKASILHVAKRGDKLYAQYEQKAWIKTNKGFIHKSIVDFRDEGCKK